MRASWLLRYVLTLLKGYIGATWHEERGDILDLLRSAVPRDTQVPEGLCMLRYPMLRQGIEHLSVGRPLYRPDRIPFMESLNIRKQDLHRPRGQGRGLSLRVPQHEVSH